MLHKKQREDGTFKNNRYLNLKKKQSCAWNCCSKAFLWIQLCRAIKIFFFFALCKEERWVGLQWDFFSTVGKWEEGGRDARKRKKEKFKKAGILDLVLSHSSHILSESFQRNLWVVLLPKAEIPAWCILLGWAWEMDFMWNWKFALLAAEPTGLGEHSGPALGSSEI